ncbi:hypothetical protein QCA50_021121 [Cerrena zonata]|uniref:UBA domain-containing protein n=1 Tax=Cerrena zonata TaxID=2478898 RepID=A0AAW0FGZ4_9APHY
MLENISRLTEMGFSPEQAQEALDITKGDVSRAIGYLFGDPIETEPPETTEEGKQLVNSPTEEGGDEKADEYMGDTVNVKNAQDIPQFNEYRQVPVEEYGSYQYIEDDSIPALNPQVEEANMLEERLYEQTKDEGVPTAIVLSKKKYLENYLIPVLVILGQSRKFYSLIMIDLEEKHDEEDKENGGDIEQAYNFLKEVQYLLYVINYREGKRQYINFDELIKNVPKDFKQKLTEVETVDEVILRIYETLNYNYNLVVGKESPNYNKIEELLQSMVESIADNVKSGLYLVEIDNDSRSSTLYGTLNQLFWEANFKKLGYMQYEKVSPVVSFHLVGDGDDDDINMVDELPSQPIHLDEWFYPQIYLSQCISSVMDLRAEEVKHEEERKNLTREILQMNFFEGKKIDQVLKQSLSYLAKLVNEDIYQDLENLRVKMEDERAKNGAKQEESRELMNKTDIRNYQNIIDHHNQQGNPPLAKYELKGVILDDSRYFFKQQDDWFYYEAYSKQFLNNNKVTDYNIVQMEDFEKIQRVVYNHTNSSINGLTLIYVEDSNAESNSPQVNYLQTRFENEEHQFLQKYKEYQECKSPPTEESSDLPSNQLVDL